MADKTQIAVSEWVNQLKAELEKRTRRKDIEVTASPYCNYDALVSCATTDKHPIVNFYSSIQGDPSRLATAFEYVVAMIDNWEATKVMHDKAKKDCLPYFERLQEEFPHLELIYSVIDFNEHYARVEKVGDKIIASFDLWVKMAESDIERIASFIKDLEATLHREKATSAGVNYFWK